MTLFGCPWLLIAISFQSFVFTITDDSSSSLKLGDQLPSYESLFCVDENKSPESPPCYGDALKMMNQSWQYQYE